MKPSFKTLALFCFLTFTVGYCIFVSATLAQTSTTAGIRQAESGEVLTTLLNEVRELRFALQRSNLTGYRIQVVIERLRIQQAHTDRIERELEMLRAQINEEASNQSQMAESAKSIEGRINKEYDPIRRADMEQEYAMLKTGIERSTKEIVRLRERESQVVRQLQSEQAKLSDYSDRLDALEREMGGHQAR